jgi:hypothetical protein
VIAACLAAGVAAASAEAATTYCVGFERPGCTTRASAGQAFADAVDNDRIELGAITVTGALSTARDITVAGTGEGRTVLAGGLTLSSPGAELSDVTTHGLRLSGTATRVHVEGLAELRAGAVLRLSLVRGDRGIDALDGTARLESVVVDVSAGPGLRVRCDATLQGRHVTLVGTPAAMVTTACATATARLSDSNLWPSAGRTFSGAGRVVTDHSNVPPAVPGHVAGTGDVSVDPGFVAGTARIAAGSPLVDAGGTDPLATAGAWPEDRAGLPRIADGNGDGALVRDIGAFEVAPPAVPLPEGNLLGDPGAEHGGGWTLSGGFVRERYGTFPFPSLAAGAALGAGEAFFAGGNAMASTATQLVAVDRFAPEIDAGTAGLTLAALLGGYRADDDAGAMEAAFLDPAGRTIGTVALAAPTPAERAQVTALLPRSRSDAIPPLTRSVLVTLRATTAAKSYNDAYFDNLALTVAAPGAPPLISGRMKPFAGVRLLTAKARLDRRRRVRLRVACVARTVGRCSGVVTLAARKEPVRLAGASVSLRPGGSRRIRLRLPARPAKQRTRLRVYIAARDGQGVVRTSVAPLVVLRRR